MNPEKFKGKYIRNSTDGVVYMHVDDVTKSDDGMYTLKGFLIYYSDDGISTDKEWECREDNDFEVISEFEFTEELNYVKRVAEDINNYLNK